MSMLTSFYILNKYWLAFSLNPVAWYCRWFVWYQLFPSYVCLSTKSPWIFVWPSSALYAVVVLDALDKLWYLLIIWKVGVLVDWKFLEQKDLRCRLLIVLNGTQSSGIFNENGLVVIRKVLRLYWKFWEVQIIFEFTIKIFFNVLSESLIIDPSWGPLKSHKCIPGAQLRVQLQCRSRIMLIVKTCNSAIESNE